MVRFAAVAVSDFSDLQLYETAYSLVNDRRRDKVTRFMYESDRRRSLAVGALLRFLLLQEGVDYETCSFMTTSNGKSYIEGETIRYNLSHSGDLAIACIGDCEMGCDVERIKSFEKGADVEKIRTSDISIAKRFFHEDEYKMIEKCTDKKEADTLFFRFWTGKESYLKMTGEGIGGRLADVVIPSAIMPGHQIIKVKDAHMRYYSLPEYEDYSIALCLKKSDFPEEIELFTGRELCGLTRVAKGEKSC